MITKYATPPNKDAMTLQMIIDDEAQTVKTGYFLFAGLPDRQIEKSVIRKNKPQPIAPKKNARFLRSFL